MFGILYLIALQGLLVQNQLSPQQLQQLQLQLQSPQRLRQQQQPQPQLPQPQLPQPQPQERRSLSGQVLVLTTNVGDIRIKLREDLSQPSADYIREIVTAGDCPRCTLYRAEKEAILQGIIKNPSIPDRIPKGECPDELRTDPKYKDNCHGPIMTRGMVGWAGGKSGPDFFIDWYKNPAEFWKTQHTVWGEVMLEESSGVIEEIWKLPTENKGLTYLVEPLKFTMTLV